MVLTLFIFYLQHCFDRYSQRTTSWSKESMELYVKKLKCIVEQYDNFIDPDLKEHLNGTVTITEDTADNGSIKLAYRAYEEWLRSTQPNESRLIALDFTPKQLFWISYAQFYCTVQREKLKKRLLDTFEVHTIDRFRVMGPLMNAQAFARDFNCPIKSRMNPDRERCAIW